MARAIQPQDLVDSTVMDNSGSKIGKVGTVYLADDTRRPEWVTVKTGLFGQKESFVPLSGAGMESDGLHVQVAKDQVSDAPRIDAEGHLSEKESVELYKYYGLPAPRGGNGENMRDRGRDAAAGGAAGGVAGTTRPAGRDTSGAKGRPSAEHAAEGGRHDASGTGDVVRSEEHLRVGTEEVETGHVRLRKYVVTEEEQVTVPVTHEEVRVEREPITDAKAAGKAEIGEAEQDVVLHAEKPVVQKETVPVERVRLGTEQVTEEQTVQGKVRKERIDIDDDTRRDKKS
ncbi:PRC and DUF2382 domain-containing protein [Amycolatopsis rubida]|uniref:PRC and DUF2382 domain-containing protein n=1 Tax=Amycolatopsis rubida TaxID=112413 RepID=A0ABX0BVA6_9PSEU|nr:MULTISPECIES: PRC and DUF2382 domain-containing protein [Amycolatopsis]MYW94569.1 DUF2382 domain-containing protein [Amycolatopsis rubida]NEC59557.1 PRC and DUF2382 domain-containing protein [Amycolatopsis rubida]OAP23296.1 Stress response protein YsnF [Amycolatopsis sp. M39]